MFIVALPSVGGKGDVTTPVLAKTSTVHQSVFGEQLEIGGRESKMGAGVSNGKQEP